MKAIGTSDVDFYDSLIGQLLNASKEKRASEKGTNSCSRSSRESGRAISLKRCSRRKWLLCHVRGANVDAEGYRSRDGAVANRALELLGKELGMFVDRRDTKSVLRLISAEPLTADEWIARHGAVADEEH
jgi:hypothetical protein